MSDNFFISLPNDEMLEVVSFLTSEDICNLDSAVSNYTERQNLKEVLCQNYSNINGTDRCPESFYKWVVAKDIKLKLIQLTPQCWNAQNDTFRWNTNSRYVTDVIFHGAVQSLPMQRDLRQYFPRMTSFTVNSMVEVFNNRDATYLLTSPAYEHLTVFKVQCLHVNVRDSSWLKLLTNFKHLTHFELRSTTSARMDMLTWTKCAMFHNNRGLRHLSIVGLRFSGDTSTFFEPALMHGLSLQIVELYFELYSLNIWAESAKLINKCSTTLKMFKLNRLMEYTNCTLNVGSFKLCKILQGFLDVHVYLEIFFATLTTPLGMIEMELSSTTDSLLGIIDDRNHKSLHTLKLSNCIENGFSDATVKSFLENGKVLMQVHLGVCVHLTKHAICDMLHTEMINYRGRSERAVIVSFEHIAFPGGKGEYVFYKD